jgi:hypothetical protein
MLNRSYTVRIVSFGPQLLVLYLYSINHTDNVLYGTHQNQPQFQYYTSLFGFNCSLYFYCNMFVALNKEFEVPPYSQSVVLGQQVELRCHPPQGVPAPRVSTSAPWSKYNKETTLNPPPPLYIS